MTTDQHDDDLGQSIPAVLHIAVNADGTTQTVRRDEATCADLLAAARLLLLDAVREIGDDHRDPAGRADDAANQSASAAAVLDVASEALSLGCAMDEPALPHVQAATAQERALHRAAPAGRA